MQFTVGHVRRKGPIIISLLGLLLLVSLAAAIIYYQEMNLQTIKYQELSGSLSNPLMGWAPWATLQQSNQPFTLVYADLTWRDFEPQEGSYDFDRFEMEKQLMRWRREGKRVVFRFVADMPGKETHLDIPDWLFNKINGRGEYYDNEYGKGFSPDYSNPVFIDSHRKAIKALGDRYGQDGFFAFIELGSLGHWGEWHTHPGLTPLPPEDIRNLYVDHYIEAFPGTYLLMRRPFSIAQRLGLGLYNDMTADVTQTNIWLGWIENGGEYLPQEVDGLSAMPNGWQKSPVGGEQTSDLSDEQIYGTHLDQTLELLKKSHTTFIGPNSPYLREKGGPLQAGLDQIMATIGYRISINQVQMPRWVLYEQYININFTFSNHGIAPMYYNWPSQIYLLDEKGNPISTHLLSMDWRKVLPGSSYEITFKMPVNHLKNGNYSIGIAILDPVTGQPAVQFANENARQDLIQYIGAFEVRRYLNSTHTQ
ncbi:MAG TPA: DUF4832 domain-containing protein [Anaerolineales bacterium]|nr:DUF4832 domain-containing protein [Anaerolineales bacterium]